MFAAKPHLWILVECGCLSGPKPKSVRNFLQLFQLNKEQMFSVMGTYSREQVRVRGSSLLCEAFLGAAYPDLSSRAATLPARAYTKSCICAKQGLERTVPRPGPSRLSLRAWGPQSGQCPAAELQSQTRALGRQTVLAVGSP